MRGHADSDHIELASLAAGMVASGLFFLATCVPAAILLANSAGEDPLASMLLLRSDAGISNLLAKDGGPLSSGEWSLILALLALYGTMSLICPLVYFMLKRAGLLKLISLSWGMFLGLALTSLWYEWASTGRLDLLDSYTPKIAYLYLTFLIAEMLKTFVEDKGLSGLPYQYGLDGAFGILSVLIISAGYPASFADLLLGPMFLVAVAVSVLFAEWALMRPATILFVTMARTVSDDRFARRLQVRTPSDRLRLLKRRFSDEILKARELTFAERTNLIQRTVAALFRKKRKLDTEPHVVSLDWRWVGGLFLFNLLFPVAGGLVAWLIL